MSNNQEAQNTNSDLTKAKKLFEKEQYRLTSYINYANDTAKGYTENRKFFLQLNLGVVLFISFIIPFLAEYFNTSSNYWLNLGFLILIGSTIGNIINNSFIMHKTKNTQSVLHHKSEEKLEYNKFIISLKKNKEKDWLIENDIKALHNLYLYQDNYYKHAIQTRRITAFGIGAFLFCLFIGVFITTFISV